MKAFAGKYKKWLGYALFFVVLTAGLLYFRFPSDAVKDFLRARAEEANPPLSVSVGRLSPSILGGVKLEKARIAFREAKDRVLLEADSLLLRPVVWSFLRGESAYTFNGSAYEGDISGRIEFKREESGEEIETAIALKDIRAEDFGYFSYLVGRPVQGTLGGTISYTGPPKNAAADGSGEARLRLVDGKMKLLEPFLTFESIDFKEMDIELSLQQRRINVARLELKGSQMQGTLSGMILLKDDFKDSSLNLKGTIEPFAAFFESSGGTRDTVAFFRQRLKQGTLSSVIQGTLGEPEVKFT